MNCALCNGRLIKKSGSVQFKSRAVGKVLVPNLEFLECEKCKEKIFSLKESDKAIDFIAKKEREAIYTLPIKDFITAKEASKILGITKQAFSKHPKIKRGLIYFVKIGDRKFYNRKSVELFKEKGNGKYLLPQYEDRYVLPKKEFMTKFYSITHSYPHEDLYDSFAKPDHPFYYKYSTDKVFIMGRQ
jgi:hypothetical protein